EVETWLIIWACLLIALGALGMVGAQPEGRCHAPLVLGGMGLYLFACAQIPHLTVSLAAWGRGLGGLLAPKIITNVADEIDVFFRPPLALLGLFYALRSEEHTSELQSRFDLVCRLLLEKKNVSH